MKFRKLTALFLSGVMVFSAASMTACTKKSELTLTVLHHRTDLDANGEMAAMTKAFEDANNCKVVYQSYTNYAEDASTKLTSPNWGDVMMIPDSVEVKDFANFFEPLGDYTDLSTKYNWTQSKMSGGKVYGMPHAGNVSGGYCYNKRVWTEAGVTSLPKTPEEFVAALKKIKEKFPDTIPLYTNYAAGWPLQGWRSFGYSATGDPDWKDKVLTDKSDLFVQGAPMYEAAKLLYNVFSDPTLIEGDPSTSEWEGCKAQINEGKVATIVLESWAVNQFKEAGPNPDDVAFAPVPFSVGGKQYAEAGADYCLGINKNISDAQKELAKKYVFWFVDESGFAAKYKMLDTKKGTPVVIENFENVTMFSFNPAPDALEGVFDAIDNDSGVNINQANNDGNYKLKIAELAFAGKPFSEVETIFAELNKKWAATRDANQKLKDYTGG